MDSEPPIPPPSDMPSNMPPAVPPVPPSPYAPQLPPSAAPPGPPPAGTQLEPLPWERPGAPFLEAMLQTIKLVMIRPREAFQRMRVTGSYERPVIFALVVGIVGLVISAGYEFAFGGLWQHVREHFGHAQGPHLSAVAKLAIGIVGSPILVALGVLISTALYHLFLMLYGASRGGLGATFRVACFAEACSVLALIPMLGGVAAAIWCLVVSIVGLAIVHRTSTGRAAASRGCRWTR